MEPYETILYSDEDASFDVYLSKNGTPYLTLTAMAALYGRDRTVISRYVSSLLKNSESQSVPTRAKIAQVQREGDRSVERKIDAYSLDIVLAIGQRLRSKKGEKLKTWLDGIQDATEDKNDVIIYDNGNVRIDVAVPPNGETVYLTQVQMAKLFEVSVQNINWHVQQVLEDNEITNSVFKYYLITASDGKKYWTQAYNLDMVLAVGYRVRSSRAIEFRRWATSVLKNHVLKGYSLDETRALSVRGVIGELAEKVVSLDNRLEESKKELGDRITELERIAAQGELPEAAVFLEGEYYSARSYFNALFAQAKEQIVVVDAYADEILLDYLSKKKAGVHATLLYGSHNPIRQADIDSFNQQYGGLQGKKTDAFHDRFLVIDGALYVLGASFNRVGSRVTTVIRLEEGAIKSKILEAILLETRN